MGVDEFRGTYIRRQRLMDRYYLKADGTMAINEKTADGYQVNNLGIWVR